MGRAAVTYPYHSLEDFLTANELTVDGRLDDGGGASFPVKGREIDATVLIADITAFSARTADLSAAETLIYVNNFFTWITASALRNGHGIVDKYVGDEIVVVFSKEFGSADPFVDAVQAARWMCENDSLMYTPHIGIASGQVIVGYVGTPLRFDCSVFGSPITMATRCSDWRPPYEGDRDYSTSITFPSSEWKSRELREVFPPTHFRDIDGSLVEDHYSWDLLEEQSAQMKNLPETDVTSIVSRSFRAGNFTTEGRARNGLEYLRKAGQYRPAP